MAVKIKYYKDIQTFTANLLSKILARNSKLKSSVGTTVRVLPGKKYYKVMVGLSGKFMLNVESGNLFYITGYGIPNYEKNFGYLPEILEKDFDWDGYSIIPVGGNKSVDGFGGQIARPRGKDE